MLCKFLPPHFHLLCVELALTPFLSCRSFSIISILTGITSESRLPPLLSCHGFWLTGACTTGSLQLAFDNGGPVSAVWGWVVVSVFTLFVGASMAEIVSILPSRCPLGRQ